MGIHFGVDYYPEHWPKKRWERDAQLMKELGIQVVRMGEFSWFKMEPEEEKFNFSWLEEAISILDKYGIKTILGTPTAAPPAWIIEKNPEIQPIDKTGKRRYFGGRHHDCQSNKVYREHIKRFVEAYSSNFSSNSGVIGWQIDNELGNSHGDLCMCDNCKQRFQDWLKRKYNTIEELNLAWGTVFWSQGYNNFNQIMPPLVTVTGENPSQLLDWKCFCSDLIVDFAKMQVEIIRKNCPNHFITHNYMCFDDKVNYYDLAELLDFVSNDIYPAGNWQKQPNQPYNEMAACHDVIRSYKKRSFWMMEQQTGIAGWATMGRALNPGESSAWAMQSIAHGADAIVFFRWRACAYGTEQYWHGILGHSGRPGRIYDEIKNMISRIKPFMDDFEGSIPKTEVGIVHSFRQNYAIQIQPNHPELKYVEHLHCYYKPLFNRNVPVDFITENEDFSKYKLIIAPLQYLMNSELENKYFEYVKNGGNLVLDMRAGVKDDNNVCMTEYELPGRLGELLGIEIPEYDCLFEHNCEVRYENEDYSVFKWADIIDIKGAKTVAYYSSDIFYKNSPAITENRYGKGHAYYIGTEPSEKLMQKIIDRIIEKNNIKVLGESTDGVDISERQKNGRKWIFVTNLTNKDQEYELSEELKMLVGERKNKLKPYEAQLFINQ
ncbi:MAG: beta-galactosidase [Butyrivibrio sp.]|nr:beta-galactosidase [Butyrivibrio sp.]